MNIHRPPEMVQALKPKMLFFRTVDRNISAFIVEHLKQQLECLRLSFDVTLIEGDCDYDRLCDLHQPDIAMFESGIYARRSTISNAVSHPTVRKVGFFNGDPYCSSRLIFLQDMRRLQIRTYFTLSTRLSEYLTEEDADIFYWPNFIDPAVHRDYGLPKSIPVLFTGSLASHYPWRNRVRQALAPRYPIMSCPHPGWFDARAVTKVATGTEYAKLINASHVTPTCGTIADEIVRKHFEIPACRSLLVTERTAGTLAAGFVDMENCLFAEPQDVVDKLEPLLRDPDKMAAITDAGHRLAHDRHTIHHRDQVLQWYRLSTAARDGERIVQPTPFAPLSIAAPARQPMGSAGSHGRLRRLLDEARHALTAGDHREAARAFARCLQYHPLPEALVGLARCQLHLGRAGQAQNLLGDWIDGVLTRYEAEAPDPVEYALLIEALLCAGDADEAVRRLAQFPRLVHSEITWAAAATAALGGDVSFLTGASEGRALSPTVHRAFDGDAASWTAELAQMMTACGRPDLAQRVTGLADPAKTAPGTQRTPPARPSQPRRPRRDFMASHLATIARHKALAPVVKRLARAMTRNGRLPKFEALPFARRFRKFDDFVTELRDLVPRVDAARTLIVANAPPSIYLDEFLSGLAANPDLGSLQVVGGPAMSSLDVDRLERLGAREVLHLRLDDVLRGEQIARFDLAFVEGVPADIPGLGALCLAADRVILSGVSDPAAFALWHAMTRAGTHALLAHDPAYGAGYAIFERWRSNSPPLGPASLTSFSGRSPPSSRTPPGTQAMSIS
ncbi:glycosyltransferase [Mesorhizobium sp. BR1-1-16]|uniref:glycosyltransferase family protein n=1 Tax=Mesorhizobium sp. BR1-1-16 TaxID=2876653 RepID=UPI001CCC09D4|nr:glycosyltransferase [Mesorhizobium sp. BR1-1-16]MBZ9936046.1 glycosyltransferase [Mesorhizobium sp. BR1-1-16]